MSTPLPYADLVTLPHAFDQAVSEEFIDENGHMNISDYFRLGSWAPWLRLVDIGVGPDYIPERGQSFFTVENHIRYLAELRLGERFSVHAGFVGRTAKALHSVGVVLDRDRERVACLLEVMYVHVSMAERRSTPIPDDIAAGIDAEIASHGWLSGGTWGLSLRQ